MLLPRTGQLVRAGAWVLGFYGVASVTAVAVAATVPLAVVPERLDVFARAFPLVVGAAVATVLGAVVRKDVAAVGWPGAACAARGTLTGVALGGAMAGGALLLALLSGARWVGTGESVFGYTAGVLVVLVGIAVAALGEELLFRGFPLATLAAAIGPVAAVTVLSVVFTLLHSGNPGVTPLALANILFASVVLSAAFFTRGALAAAWGVHAAWNGGLVMADAPVSGIRFDLPFIDFAPGAHDWMNGGAFGPEGGLAASVALGGGLAWLSGRLVGVRPVEAA